MGTQSKDSITEIGIIRTKRDFPPKDYAIRIKQFSLLAEKHKKYESLTFEAGGYKWRLWLYPKGKTSPPDNGKDPISLYLAIQDTDSLPKTWEVNVDFKLFVFNQKENKYLAVQDVKRFHEMKTVWGFVQFLPIGTFSDAFNGYLVDDTCVFGAEVLVIKPSGILESIHTVKEPSDGVHTWKITLMPLEDLREAFNGFVVNDTLTVEAVLLFLTGAKVVS